MSAGEKMKTLPVIADESEAPLPAAIVPRTDRITEAIVEEGIALLVTQGFEQAAAFLSEKMVPLHISRRVLLTPSARRKSRTEK